MKIEVEPLKLQILESLSNDGMTKANACFQNCFLIVAFFGHVTKPEMELVLCWLTDNFDQRHAHAIIKIGDS